jgi:ribosome modulation factor
MADETDEQLMMAFREGAKARNAGQPRSDCPYHSIVYFHAWMTGWYKSDLAELEAQTGPARHG